MCSQTPKQGNVKVENNGKKWLRSYKESLTQMNIASRTSCYKEEETLIKFFMQSWHNDIYFDGSIPA